MFCKLIVCNVLEMSAAAAVYQFYLKVCARLPRPGGDAGRAKYPRTPRWDPGPPPEEPTCACGRRPPWCLGPCSVSRLFPQLGPGVRFHLGRRVLGFQAVPGGSRKHRCWHFPLRE